MPKILFMWSVHFFFLDVPNVRAKVRVRVKVR